LDGIKAALNERVRIALHGAGDGQFEPGQVAEAYVEASNLPPDHPMYPHALLDVTRRVRRVIRSDTTDGVPTWMWVGRGSVFQRATAMSLATIESLEYRNEAVIEGFLRRKKLLRAMHLIKEGADAAEAARQAQEEHEQLLEALQS
jgi:hypothetical protein